MNRRGRTVQAQWVLLLLLPFASSAFADQGPSPPAAGPLPSPAAEALPDFTVTDDDSDEAEAEGDGLGDLDDLLDADLSQLARTEIAAPVFGEEVTTVARRESTVGRSPAAVYVITGEMIRRSGVRSIPEALRLAPGVQVAKIDSNKWAISIRGFNERFSNKLLVQIDGRSVYTPLFAGVFWDVQDVLLEDIDRIEIIRGPGASVWGVNAVNGVINIITKRADDTQGLFAEGGGGDERGFASARIGGETGAGAWRVYGKWFDRDGGAPANSPAADDWHVGRLGFRSDWRPADTDTLTLQGDYYDGDAGQFQTTPIPTPPFLQSGPDNQRIAGGNVLMRWSRQLDDDSDWALQCYYDRTERTIDSVGFREDRDTADVDWQHNFLWNEIHFITWGLGYRNTSDHIRNTPFFLQFIPASRSVDCFSTFAQDQMTLLDDLLYLTVGSKFSWSDYTNFEYQPTARLLYTPDNRKSAWASVSRAVRTPSRASDDVRLIAAPIDMPVFPTFPLVLGNRDVNSEELLAWEIGMRSAPTDKFYWDVAAFYNQYEGLNSSMTGVPGIDPVTGVFALPLIFFNGYDAESYGFELASTWEAHKRLALRGGYSFVRIDAHGNPLIFAGTPGPEGESPRNQFFFHSSWDLGYDWEFDLMGRYVDTVPQYGVPSYFELDTRLAWRPTKTFELALVGRNLLDGSHPEHGDDFYVGLASTETPRELYGVITWRY